MNQKIYTIGYGRSTPQRLLNIVTSLDAVLVDIRYRAQSRKPEWNKGRLVGLFGSNYTHQPTLGNELYKSNGMKIVNYAAGRDAIESIGRSVVLLCACHLPEGCHRTVVADMLRADGFDVTELNVPAFVSKSRQETLWTVARDET